MSELNSILKEASLCTVCAESLPHNPRPVLAAAPEARIIIVGQAPGRRVHESGVPWQDPSGDRLREWMNVSNETFYDANKIALLPMGFCYPGKGKSGDLPPRPECAPLWHGQIMSHLNHVELVLLVGIYAQKFYLGEKMKPTLTETVRAYQEYLPRFLPMAHPSPRNIAWRKNNPWFEKDLLPLLRQKVSELVG